MGLQNNKSYISKLTDNKSITLSAPPRDLIAVRKAKNKGNQLDQKINKKIKRNQFIHKHKRKGLEGKDTNNYQYKNHNTLKRIERLQRYYRQGKYVYIPSEEKMMLIMDLVLKPVERISRELNPIREVRLTDFVFPMDSTVLNNDPKDRNLHYL